jgi:hypothetical protein
MEKEKKVKIISERKPKLKRKISIYDDYKRRNISKIKKLFPKITFKELIQYVTNSAKNLGIIGNCMEKWYLLYKNIHYESLFNMYPLIKTRYYAQIDNYEKNMKRKPDIYFYFK